MALCQALEAGRGSRSSSRRSRSRSAVQANGAGGTDAQLSASLPRPVLPDPHEVLRWSVMCLYWDQAVPKGVLLQWALQLLFGVKVAPRKLLKLFEKCPGLRVEFYGATCIPTSKRLAFQAHLKAPPDGCPGFVSEDTAHVAKQSVTDGVWQELLRVVALGGWAKAKDGAHKFFVVANHLQQVSPVLRPLGFGRLLSLVRAADREGDMLGHRNGLLVPYHESEEYERFQNASSGMPTHVQPDESYVRTWDELRVGLSKLLLAGNGVLDVSRIKHQFRMELGVELSETVLGHQTLSRLLSDYEITKDFLLGERTLRRRFELRSDGLVENLQTRHA